MSKRSADLYPWTDSGNAELIAARFKDSLRFDHQRKRWLVWRRKRWQEDRDGAVFRMAKAAARERLRAAACIREDDKREAMIDWARLSESHYRLKAALELAKNTAPIANAGNRWDSDPFLLGVGNGVVDLRTGHLRTARPQDRITLNTEILYEPSARCPRFEQFLREAFSSDAEVIQFVQKAVGYSLSGDVTEQCLFACCGDGANGKSTLLEIIRYVLGDYAHNLPFSAFELTARSSISNDIAGVASKRFVTAVETNENVRLNEGRLKALTGGDRCTARFLYQENFSFDPTAKFWLAFNHKPRVTDDSHGFWRRIRLIPFTTKFSDSNRDKDLPAKLRAEAQGILSWAVRGCLLWQQEGLGVPPAVDAATKTYRQENDAVGEFIEERYLASPDGFVSSSVLRAEYEYWAQENGETALDPRALADRLRARGLVRDRGGQPRVRGWRGLQKRPGPFTGEVVEIVDTRTGEDAKIQ